MVLLKGAAEHAFAGKAGVEADVLHGKAGIFQKVSGGGETGIDQIFMRGEAGFLFEGADEMVLAQARLPGKPGDGNVLGEMLVDEGDGPFRHIRAAAGAAAFRRKEQKFREDVRQIAGQQRFAHYAAAVKNLQDVGQPAQNGMGIGEGEYISQSGNNVSIMGSCRDTVKMAPQTFPSGLRGIGMSFVAVDQDELSGRGMKAAALKGQLHFSLLNIHQQKAVEGFSGEGITRQIGKQAALQRVQEHFLRHAAG